MKQFLRLLAVSVVSLAMLASVILPALAESPQSSPASTSAATAGWHSWARMARVRVMTANVRSCPSTRCRVVGKLHYGAPVRAFVRVGGWTSIAPGRWVATYLLRS